MANKNILIRNVLSNWMGFSFSLLVAFFLSPFLVHTLGDSMYGLWVLVLSTTGYMGLLDAGLKISIIKYVSRFNATSDTKSLNNVLDTSLAIYSLLGILVLICTTGLMFFFEHFFSVHTDAIPTAKVLVFLTGCNVALTLPLSVFGGLLVGLQRYDYMNKINILVGLVRAIVIVGFISQGFGVIALGLIQLSLQVIIGTLLVLYSYRQYPQWTPKPLSYDKETIKMLYGYGGFVLMNNIAMFLLFYSGEFLIGIFLGTVSVTYYAIARNLIQYLSSFIGAMTQVLHPYTSDQDARGNKDNIQKALILGTKGSLVIVLPIGITFLILGETFIGLWMGPSYAKPSGTVLTILTLAQIVWLSQSSTGNILFGVEKHRFLTILNIVTGIFGILLSLIFIKYWGIYGVALGMSIPIIFSQTLILPTFTISAIGITFRRYFVDAYIWPILSVVPYTIVLLLIKTYFEPNHLYGLFFQILICLLSYLAVAYFTCLDKADRNHLRRYLTCKTLIREVQNETNSS